MNGENCYLDRKERKSLLRQLYLEWEHRDFMKYSQLTPHIP
jgi:hypothetical protein